VTAATTSFKIDIDFRHCLHTGLGDDWFLTAKLVDQIPIGAMNFDPSNPHLSRAGCLLIVANDRGIPKSPMPWNFVWLFSCGSMDGISVDLDCRWSNGQFPLWKLLCDERPCATTAGRSIPLAVNAVDNLLPVVSHFVGVDTGRFVPAIGFL